MKRILLIICVFLISITVFSQYNSYSKKILKVLEPYAVDTMTVLDKTFAIGDTITLLSGSGVNGEFLSVAIYSLDTYNLPSKDIKMTANQMGRKLIIARMFDSSDGLNEYKEINCWLDHPANKVQVTIDPVLGLTKEEFK